MQLLGQDIRKLEPEQDNDTFCFCNLDPYRPLFHVTREAKDRMLSFLYDRREQVQLFPNCSMNIICMIYIAFSTEWTKMCCLTCLLYLGSWRIAALEDLNSHRNFFRCLVLYLISVFTAEYRSEVARAELVDQLNAVLRQNLHLLLFVLWSDVVVDLLHFRRSSWSNRNRRSWLNMSVQQKNVVSHTFQILCGNNITRWSPN